MLINKMQVTVTFRVKLSKFYINSEVIIKKSMFARTQNGHLQVNENVLEMQGLETKTLVCVMGLL